MNENEILTNESGEEIVDNSVDYISAIKEMKQNSVARSEYEKLKEENRNLLKSLVNGETIDVQVDKEPVDIDAIKKKFNNSDMNNLEYIKTALDLRNAVIERDGIESDPFLPKGHNVTVTENDFRTAARVADVFQHCVDYADGDSEVFTNELMRLTRDNFVKPGRKH